MAKIAILGSGGWGTALAVMLAKNGHAVCLWSLFPEEIETLRKDHENKKLLPGVLIPEDVELTNDCKCVMDKDLVIFAVPSFAIRDTAKLFSEYLSSDSLVANVSKGFEKETLKFLTQVLQEELPTTKIVALSGPSHAEEVGRGLPTTIVSASQDLVAAEAVQDIVMNDTLRIYTNQDLVGVELAAALKNVIALCTGICDGMGYGDNTRAALITRGLHELSCLGVAMGAQQATFAGLAGVGDLIVTCTSMHSRNHRFGILIGEGVSTQEALEKIGMTVEGYHVAKAAQALSEKYHVSMPIIGMCCRVLYEGMSPELAVNRLMARPKCSETEDFAQ